MSNGTSHSATAALQISGMVRLTLREMWAKKIVLGMFAVGTLAWLLLAAALNLDIVDGSLVGLRLFGQEGSVSGEEGFTLEKMVIAVEGFVAGAAYWLGTLLGLFAAAPLLNGLLERGQVDLLLSKPMSRSRLLSGHVLGVWFVAFVLAFYLMGMVWLVMSIKTGVWNVRFLLAIPIVVGMFAVMYSVVTFLMVAWQSTALALIVTYGLIFASLILAGQSQIVPQLAPFWRPVFLACYHVLPNFAEVTKLIAQLTDTEGVSTWYPLISSLAFGAALYGGAVAWFTRRDF